jgi:hypothetical protein
MSLNTEPVETTAEVVPSLASLAPSTIHNLSPSETYAIVAVKGSAARAHIEHRRVAIPQQFHSCPIFRCLLQYFNSNACKQSTELHNYHRVCKFYALAEWAQTEYPDAKQLPVAFIQDYVLYLRTKKEHKQNTICVHMSAYRTVFDNFLDESYGNPGLAETAQVIREALAYIPSVSNRPSKATSSLGQITNQAEKDELKIVRSTIRYCCQFLRKMNEQRRELLADHDVKAQLDALLLECDGDYTKLKYNVRIKNFGTVYRPLAAAILNSQSLELKERILHNRIDFCYALLERDSPLTIDEANNRIKLGMNSTGNFVTVQPDNPEHKLMFHNIDYLHLIKHSPSEELAFAWLLATDRIQLSGVEDMRLGDLRITPSYASPIFTKGRSEQPIRDVPMHYRKSMQYKAYVEFDELKNSFHAHFPESGDYLFDLPGTAHIQCIDNLNFRPLMMAAFPQTAQFKSQHEADTEVAIFADIIRRVTTNNRPLWLKNQRRWQDITGLDTRVMKSTEIKRQTITITAIAQSRAILDIDGGNPENEAFEKYSQEVVGADATAHSPGVKAVVYMHASETKYRLNKRAKFASGVGHLMVEDARKVQAAIRDEALISVADLKVMLGWAQVRNDVGEMEEFDQLLQSAQTAGYSVSPFGQLEKNNNTFIITNAITAALLMGYRDECLSQLKRISVEDDLKAFAISMQAAYVEDALKKFAHKTVAEGEAMLKNYTFPTPVIR